MTKFVGGPADGKNIDVGDRADYTFYEGPPIARPFAAATIATVDEMTTVTQHRYTLRRHWYRAAEGKKEHIDFFAPEYWSDHKAVKHQFEK